MGPIPPGPHESVCKNSFFEGLGNRPQAAESRAARSEGQVLDLD